MVNVSADTVTYEDKMTQLLTKPSIQKELAVLFSRYYGKVHYISDIASVENGGVRPEGLANEMYACMHHIARGLATGNEADAVLEIKKAEQTHLKRLCLDAYKIAINSFLNEYNDHVTALKYLVLEDSFKNVAPDAIEIVGQINETAIKIKTNYLEAKKAEVIGKHKEAEDSFHSALLACYDLRAKIQKVTSDHAYTIALALEAKKSKEEKEREHQKRIFAVRLALLSAACGCVGAIVTELVLRKFF
ncbi:MAG: hypothetical protein J6C30_00745 [Lentisphaeria bacterium]|nr:hypothetical protein [Lentisphaeria bacterium]